MLLEMLGPLTDELGFLRLFEFITFRTGGAVMTSLLLCFVLGGPVIRWLRHKQREGQPIRSDGPAGHLLTKKGTPTMGGVLVLLSVSLSTLIWMDIENAYVWIVLLVTAGFGLVGFADDYVKLTRRTHQGLPGKLRVTIEVIIALAAAWWFSRLAPEALQTTLAVPFFKDVLIELGWFFLPFAMFVIVGASNAVNLTDGLDGLAIVPIMIAAACFGLIAYLVGNTIYSEYLGLHYVPGSGGLAVFCGALVGAALGFLWFNAPPAMVFMGDTGSLSVGGALGAISVVTKHELVLAIIGGLFVLETASVIVQVASYKLTGKRVFRMAPLHHHFEQKGWQEATIVIRFWIIASILALIGLATLKLR